jgi:hypothetical protein
MDDGENESTNETLDRTTNQGDPGILARPVETNSVNSDTASY